MPKYRVCLFFSDTGGGHRSATEAVAAALGELISSRGRNEELILTVDNIVEKSHIVNRWFVDMYNFLLRHHQEQMKYYYWFLHLIAPNNNWLGYFLVADYLKKLILKNRPSVIVSVHPMINHYLAKALNELGLGHKIKLIEVVTDPNAELWKGWACSQSDLIIAPNDLARNKLVSYGVAPEKIKIMGMPVHPSFLKSASCTRDEFLNSVGLSGELPTVCINAGWAGGGNMLQLYKSLLNTECNIQILFMCGRNEELYQTATRAAENAKVPTRILKYTKSMPNLMNACDLMVTKAGGLTSFEAIASRLPLALDMQTPPMPQEKGTAEMLIQQKLAVPIFHPDDTLKIARSVKKITNRESIQIPSMHSLNHTNAVHEIAQTILAACDHTYDPITEIEILEKINTVYGTKYRTLGFNPLGH